MFYTYDTKNFTDADYQIFQQMQCVKVRESLAKGEHYRGKLIQFDGLMYTKDQITAVLPKGFVLTASEYPNSDGCIKKLEAVSAEPSDDMEQKKVLAIRHALQTRGETAAITLFSDMVNTRTLIKGKTILTVLQLLCEHAKITGFVQSNVFDIFRSVSPLRQLYFENQEKVCEVQQLLDKLVTKEITLQSVENPYTRIYLKGMLDLFSYLPPTES